MNGLDSVAWSVVPIRLFEVLDDFIEPTQSALHL